MKAMVFAAGLGTRLKPFTENHPKALVPLGGIPMLQRVILRLRQAGVDDIVVNVHHFASQIVDFLEENHNFGINIHISDETDRLLDTGGGLLKARRWLDGDDPFFVHNADIFTDVPLSDILEAQRSAGALSTLLVADRKTSRYLLFDSDMRMHGWTNAATGEVRPSYIDAKAANLEKFAFGGLHVISPAIFPLLESFAASDTPFSIMDFYIKACADVWICGFKQPKGSFWYDIGRPESLAAAEFFNIM